MTIPTESENVYRVAETLDKQLRIIKTYIQAVNDNTSVSHIIEAYKHCVTAMNYFNSLTVDMTKVGDAIALQFGNDSYAVYQASYLALKNTKIPAFLTKIENNQSFIFDQYSLNTTTGDEQYGSLAQGARDSIMSNVTAILEEFS